MARFVSLLVLIAILVIISIIFFQVMAGFFVPLFLAALLGVVVQPLHSLTVAKCRGHQYWAAGITTTLARLIVLLPVGFVVTTATLEGLSLIDEFQLADVRKKLNDLRTELGLQIPREQDVPLIDATVQSWRGHTRPGEPLDIPSSQIENVLTRVENLEKWLKADA